MHSVFSTAAPIEGASGVGTPVCKWNLDEGGCDSDTW